MLSLLSGIGPLGRCIYVRIQITFVDNVKTGYSRTNVKRYAKSRLRGRIRSPWRKELADVTRADAGARKARAAHSCVQFAGLRLMAWRAQRAEVAHVALPKVGAQLAVRKRGQPVVARLVPSFLNERGAIVPGVQTNNAHDRYTHIHLHTHKGTHTHTHTHTHPHTRTSPPPSTTARMWSACQKLPSVAGPSHNRPSCAAVWRDEARCDRGSCERTSGVPAPTRAVSSIICPKNDDGRCQTVCVRTTPGYKTAL